MKCLLGALVLIAMSWSGAAMAGNAPTLIKAQGTWKSYSFLDQGKKVCFMSGQPKKQAGKFKKRGEVFFFVTRWMGDKDKNVVSVSNGYRFKPGSSVTVKVGGRSFKLFTQGEMAWTKDQSMDDAITAALQTGSTLVVKGTSQHGTETTDTYSLKGSGAIYRTLATACSRKK
ncbi:MAG: hypothetical protein HY052_08650 [Proteobacteria bacterium]|nr:hypothetical protein [Pseudomonadota bacterium]